jgi:penicillin-binding protein 1A
MGITSPLDPYPSITLGGLTIGVSPLEMASAYGTLAAQGTAHRPYAVVNVLDRKAEKVIVNEAKPVRALEAEVANKVTAVLERVVENGTGKRAQGLGRPAAGKTGTTDDYRDSWFAGFTPQLSTAVWIGYPKARIPLLNIHGLPRVYGGSLPAEIWTRFMLAAHEGLPEMDFPDVSLGRGSSSTGSTSDGDDSRWRDYDQPRTIECWKEKGHCRKP